MGGLRQYLPRTYWAFLIGALALTGIPPFVGVLLQGPDPRRGARRAAGTAQLLFVGRDRRRVPHRSLHVPDGLHRLRRRAVRVRARAPPPARRTEPSLWMAWPVGVLAVLAVVGGWLQFAGRLAPGHRLPRPGRGAARRADRRRRSSSRASLAVGVGLAGIARRLGGLLGADAGRSRGSARARASSSTSSTSTSSTTGLLPADRRARASALRDWFERPRPARLDRRSATRRAPDRRASLTRVQTGSCARTRSRSPAASPSSPSSSSAVR